MKQIWLHPRDGHPISCYTFSPSTVVRGRVIIAPAMGIAQCYYHDIACWLASKGFEIYTFDYRAIGESRLSSLKSYRHSILDWAQLDASAVLEQVLAQPNNSKLIWLGHSLGGQVFPLVDQIEKVDSVITIASGTGYWKHNASQIRNKIWWFWHVIVPVSIKLYGYYPGKKIGMVGDLPSSIMAQWRSWCLHPEYCVGVEGVHVKERFEKLSMPVASFALEDDEMLSLKNVTDLYAMFGTGDKQLHILSASQMGLERIGHIGFFKRQYQQSLWEKVLLPALMT